MKPYVIGNDSAVLGFALVGIDGRMVRNAEELDLALDRAMNDRTIGLILVTADVAEWSRERVDNFKVNSLSPLVVEIPGETTGTTYPSLQDFVQRAVGIRLGGR